MTSKQVTIQEKKLFESKPYTDKYGKPQTLHKAAVKIKEQWYNGTLFNEAQLNQFNDIKPNDKLELTFKTNTWQGKQYINWTLPSKSASVINNIITRLEVLESIVKQINPELFNQKNQ